MAHTTTGVQMASFKQYPIKLAFTAYAQVPAGVDWIVYATDAMTGKVFSGKVDTKTGNVSP